MSDGIQSLRKTKPLKKPPKKPMMRPVVLGLVSSVFLSTGLTACNSYLSVRSLETSIKQELEKQGGIIVQTVICPKDVPIATGTFFQCKGILQPRGEFVALVEQQDEAGKLKWEILNSNGLLNLPRLEKRLQKEIATEIGSEPTIKCSTGTRQFRTTKPGDSFDCKVLNGKLTSPQGQIDKLTVKVDAQGNVNWQQFRTVQLVASPAPRPGASPLTTPGKSAASPAASPSPQASPAASPATASPTAKSADELLNDPNATDGFD
jgi:hypothetical protein